MASPRGSDGNLVRIGPYVFYYRSDTEMELTMANRDAAGLNVTGLNGTILLGFVRPDTTRFVYQGTRQVF